MDNTRVSVIMPVYNNVQFIEAAIKGIIDFADQLIIVEGAWNPELPRRSTDGTWEVVKGMAERDDRIELIPYHHSDSLPLPVTDTYRPPVLANELEAKRQALKQVTGNWWMLVDSDEFYEPDALVRLKEYLDNFTDIEDEAFSFSLKSFVFYFGFSFGTRESFHRINSIRGEIVLDYTDNLVYDIPHTIEEIPEDIAFMFHYGYVGDERVKAKMSMWDADAAIQWYDTVYLPMTKGQDIGIKNFHLFADKLGYGGKFEKFEGEHPKLIQELINRETV